METIARPIEFRPQCVTHGLQQLIIFGNRVHFSNPVHYRQSRSLLATQAAVIYATSKYRRIHILHSPELEIVEKILGIQDTHSYALGV